METFETRALQLATDLTQHNTSEGKVGQGYVEARALDIRRTFNILCGHGPEGQPARNVSGKRRALAGADATGS
ncbi:hypothetical protein DEIPH_ctg004orf0140 [Deinococcus phoenicis]|uniref:Uncharacterized protein n=1 Tax=Deinococcus phoenicis TaxID=1476583 RepID=A0A016QUH5_9DEIO|nr:hypothetical protein [Deinococcus phoenicis]EYB69616.1 hypothetical protein DEIPH_ctg004orf0140 [Deinococcus phoenicis]